MQIKKAVILAGGLGTRLEKLTEDIPKPLLDVKGKPILEHLFDLAKKYGIKDIILAIGVKSIKIKEYFGDGSRLGLNVSYVVEEEPLGTAGCLNFLKNELDETFVMMNGDELKDIDITKMLEFHKKNKAEATIALVETDDVESNGVVDIENQRIKRFVEKPKKDEAPSNLINSGFYILEPSVIEIIEGRKFAMLEKDIFPKLAEKGTLYGYAGGLKQWLQTDTIERLERAKREWKGIK